MLKVKCKPLKTFQNDELFILPAQLVSMRTGDKKKKHKYRDQVDTTHDKKVSDLKIILSTNLPSTEQTQQVYLHETCHYNKNQIKIF